MCKNATVKLLSITRTEEEWKAIYNRIGDKKFSVYVRGEIFKLKRKIEEHPENITSCLGENIEKRLSLPITVHDELDRLATKLGLDPGNLVNRYIISPLLDNYEATGKAF